MNLEELRKQVCALKEVEWCGRKVWLRKLSAADHIELFSRVKSENTKPLSPEDDLAATLKLQIELVARTACDENDTLLFADEGRELLSRVGFADLVDLGGKVLEYSGHAVNEKKS